MNWTKMVSITRAYELPHLARFYRWLVAGELSGSAPGMQQSQPLSQRFTAGGDIEVARIAIKTVPRQGAH